MSSENEYISWITLHLPKGFYRSFLVVMIFLISLTIVAQTPVIVSEGNSHGNFTDQDRIIKLNTSGTDVILFPSNDEFNGRELWKYDEATGNSTLVKDINSSISTDVIGDLTFFNNRAFFYNKGQIGSFIWSSDGTSAGTSIYYEIPPGIGGYSPRDLTVVNSQMFFSAYNGTQLWKTNGNYPSASLIFVKSIFNDSDIGQISNLFKAGNNVYFLAQTWATSNFQLWVSDGTNGGTILLKDFGTNPPALFYEYNGLLIFLGNDGTNGSELWKSDGTVAGTQMVVDLFPGSNGAFPIYYTTLNGLLYFRANNSIYSSDGSAAGTFLAINQNGYSLKALNGSLYFVTTLSSGNGSEIYKSDGTNSGTVLLKSFEYFDIESSQTSFFENGTNVFFNIRTREYGDEIWKTSGTAASTVLLKDIRLGIFDSNPSNFVKSGSKVYFTATNGQNGFGLYKTDGSSAGTIRLNNFIGINNSTSPDEIGVFNDNIFYNGNKNFSESFFGINTTSNPHSASNINLKNASNYLTFNGNLYFGGESNYGIELFKTDGIQYYPSQIKDIFTGTTGSTQNSSNPTGLKAFNSTHFMFAAQDANGLELWKSDGTTAGTIMVKDINTSGDSNPSSLIEFNGKMYFLAFTSFQGTELWKSDGTAANTVLVQNNNGNLSSFDISSARILKNSTKLIFPSYNFFSYGLELFSSDGNSINLVKDIRIGTQSSNPENLTNGAGENIFFTADNTGNNRELWITNGTSIGTYMVKNINPSGSSNPNNLIFLNGILYFSADDGTNGYELWRSDGTDAGTFMLKDIHYGFYNSDPRDFCVVNNALYFSAEDAHHGRELWKTDGTASGTVLAYNIADDFVTEINSSNPFSLTYVNGLLYFSADNKVNGREFFYYKPCAETNVLFSQYSRLRSSSQGTTATIEASNMIRYGRTNHLQAPQSINLNPGFSVKALDDYRSVNNVFSAEIKACY